MIPWEWIVDEAREMEREPSWRDPAAYVRAVRRSYRRDFWAQQPHRVEVWSEKGTVRGTLKPVIDEYGVREDRLQQWMERHGSTLVERVAGEGEAEKVEADAEEEWQKVSAVDVAFPVDDPDSSRTLRDEERLAEWARAKVAEGPVDRHAVREVAQKNPAVARAILRDPLTLQGVDPILPEDDRGDILEARVRERWPERMARIETRRRVAKLIRRNVDTGRKALKELGIQQKREDNAAALVG